MTDSKKQKSIIISLGGSLIVPDQIDVGFLKNFKKMLEEGIKKGFRYVIITGGGKTSRRYSSAAKQVSDLTNDDLDWLGIHSTRLNGHLIRTIFKKYARPRIITDPHDKKDLKDSNYPVIVAAGYRPGYSTDYDAVALAQEYGIGEILNLSNIDFVYDKDPKKFAGARPISEISWSKFRKIVGNKWDPGLNAPFDPVASKLAQELKLKVVIMNGRDIGNIKNYLNGGSFKGTVIS